MRKAYVGFGIAVVLASATVYAGTFEDQLLRIARVFGNSQNRIAIDTFVGRDATGDPIFETKYIATAESTSSFAIYTAGDTVSNSASLAGCAMDATGAPVACDPVYGEPLALSLGELLDEDPTGFGVAHCYHPYTSPHVKCTIKIGDRCYSCTASNPPSCNSIPPDNCNWIGTS